MGAKIYNSNLTKEIIDGAKLQQAQGQIPQEIGTTVVPVMEVNPKMLRIANVLISAPATNSTSQTIYTTPADKDFYLTACCLSFVKDITATTTAISLTAFPKNKTSSSALLRFNTTTLTVERDSTNISLAVPILLERNSIIAITSSTNVANFTAGATVIGYTVDNINA